MCNVYMGVENRPQQFFMPDKGTGTPGRGKREQKELERTIQELTDGKPINVFSSEPKVDPSSPPTKPISKELKKIYRQIEKRSRQTKTRIAWNNH